MLPSDPSPFADAPLFHQFWDNGALNPSRALAMGERIAHDAARAYAPPRPMHAAAGIGLPALAPYEVTLAVTSFLGTQGIEVIGANRVQRFDISESGTVTP